MNLELYVDNCVGCDHYRTYDFVSLTKDGHLTIKCPFCGLTVTLIRADLEEMTPKGID